MQDSYIRIGVRPPPPLFLTEKLDFQCKKCFFMCPTIYQSFPFFFLFLAYYKYGGLILLILKQTSRKNSTNFASCTIKCCSWFKSHLRRQQKRQATIFSTLRCQMITIGWFSPTVVLRCYQRMLKSSRVRWSIAVCIFHRSPTKVK